MNNICFVTTEIYPATKGGIGKLIYENIKVLDKSDNNVFILFAGDKQQYQQISKYCHQHLKRCKVYHHEALISNLKQEENIPLWAFHFQEYHLSYQIAQALKILTLIEKISIIEFCDYLGLGYVTLKERKLTDSILKNVHIQVKLHGSKELCDVADGEYLLTKRQSLIYHMEKYTLEYADKWVSPSMSMAKHYQNYYQLRPDDIRYLTPCFEKIGTGKTHPRSSRSKTFMFYGKLQQLKGIATFIKAGVKVLNLYDDKAQFHIYGHEVQYEWCSSYEDHLKSLIPPKYKNNFIFKGRIEINQLQEETRNCIAAVVPSVFETFCLAAHELNWIGIPLIINDIAAFADFFSENDAFKFNGTVEHLAETMGKILKGEKKVEKLNWNAAGIECKDEQLFSTFIYNNNGHIPLKTDFNPLVSVIIPYYNMEDYVEDAIESVLNSNYSNKEIIVVNDGSPNDLAIKKLDSLSSKYKSQKITILHKENGGLGSARNYGIRHSKGKYILPLDSDDELHPNFISTAVYALEMNQELTAVNCYVNFYEDGKIRTEHLDYVIPYDLNPQMIFIENRAGVASSMFRKEIFEKISYNEQLTSYEDWEFWWKCVNYGFKVEVIPQILFHYRRRLNSMVNSEGLVKHAHHLHKIIDLNTELVTRFSPVIFKQMVTFNNHLWIENIQLKENYLTLMRTNNPTAADMEYTKNQLKYANGQLNDVKNWYHNEYEVLPLWFKRLGHIVKVFQGRRTFKSLFSDK